MFDAIVIGTGQAGPALAARFSAAGRKVAVIERHKFGGTCVNDGCTPMKTLIASAYSARMAVRAAEYGVQIEGATRVDMKRVNDAVPYLRNVSMMEIDYAPEHLVVVGGSYVGLEFAQVWRRFGSRVTVVEMGPRLIGREDEDVSQAVKELLQADGIEVRLNANCVAVEKDGAGIAIGVDCKEGAPKVSGSHLLLAVGRVPNTDDLGLETAGNDAASHTPAHIRAVDASIDAEDRAYVRRKLGMKLGKFARAIERVSVRIKDVNGPRGGIDKLCRIKVVLSELPSVVVEQQHASLQAAVDRSLRRTEVAARRSLQRRHTRAR